MAVRHRPLKSVAVCLYLRPILRRYRESAKRHLQDEADHPKSFPGSFVSHQMMKEYPVPHPERIIRLKTVLHRTGLSRSTLYRKIAEGSFPRQITISIHGTGWHESAVDRWIANPAAFREDRAE